MGYDIDAETLHELPNAICAIVRANAEPAPPDDGAERAALEAQLRAATPDPALFDELLDGARRAYGLRDDNGPLTWSWPAGLLRRAYLEAGDRLHGAGSLVDPALVFELDVPEVRAWLADGTGLDATELTARADLRRWESELDAPDWLGPNPPDTAPDLSALPPGLARSMGIVVAASALLEPDVGRDETPLTGLGIGAEPYRGVARVCDDPAQAISEMEPGDVLVASCTAPSFNAVLAIAGAIVIEEGGLLCHAAVMARELDLPAVIGCQEAMARITTGDLVEVDPTSGVVTLVA